MTPTENVIDLTADLPLETAVLAMLRPGTETPTGWELTMAGPSHPKTVAYQNERKRYRVQKQATIEAAQVNGRKYKPDQTTADEAETETMRWVVSRIVSWTPVKVGQDTIEFSDEAAIALLRKPAMAPFLQQIVDYLGAERSFLPSSAKI